MAGTAATANDGPILTVINKRLRALRKKLNRITQMEESIVRGKSLNKEQTEALSSKSDVVARIAELERLLQHLPGAINQEIEIALEKNQEISERHCEGKTDAKENDGVSAVSDLLNLVYFGSVFDVQTLMAANDNMLMRTHERNCCLTYDYVTDDASASDLLKDQDLDLISSMGNLVISRPSNSRLSHKNALEKCAEHARLWLANSDQPIEPHSSVTYADLREKLNKIVGSDYFTTNPQINPIEVAATLSNYNYFQCSEHESMIPQVDYAVSLEDLVEESEDEEEQSHNLMVIMVKLICEETHQGVCKFVRTRGRENLMLKLREVE